MKKLMCVVMAILMSLSVAIIASADNDGYSGGLIWDEISTDEETTLNDWNEDCQAPWSSCLNRINNPVTSENYCSYLGKYIPGDINNDTSITAADARTCLRAAAKIEELDKKQTECADVNGDGKLTSADARIILRAAAKLENSLEMTIETYVGNGFVMGKLPSGGSRPYSWTLTGDTDAFAIDTKRFDNTRPGTLGGDFDLYYIFTAEKAGNYTVRFTFAGMFYDDVLIDFTLNIIVK